MVSHRFKQLCIAVLCVFQAHTLFVLADDVPYKLLLNAHSTSVVAAEALAVQPEVGILTRNYAGQWVPDTSVSGLCIAAQVDSQGSITRANLADAQRYLGGSLTVVHATFERGVARFSNLSLATAGVAYRLAFQVTNLPPLLSAPINVTRGPPYTIAILRQPAGSAAGLPLDVQPMVGVVDRGGNLLSDFSNASVSVRTASPGMPLYGQRMVATIVQGVAAFDGLYVRNASRGHRLCFDLADPRLAVVNSSVCSQTFAVHHGPPHALTVQVQPLDAVTAGVPWEESIVVALVDAAGNLMDADAQDGSVSVQLVNEADGSVGEPLFPKDMVTHYPPHILRATASRGSAILFLTSSAPLELSDWPPIMNGDVLEIGTPPPDQECQLYGIYCPPHREVEASADVTPPVARRVRIKYILHSSSSGMEVHLVEAWAGASVIDMRVAKVEPSLTRPIVRGQAVFERLAVNRAGPGFALLFSYYNGTQTMLRPLMGVETAMLEAAARGVDVLRMIEQPLLSVTSTRFRVHIGDPAKLVLVKAADLAASGNMPCGVQPVLAVADVAGNVVPNVEDAFVSVRVSTSEEQRAQQAERLPQGVLLEAGGAVHVPRPAGQVHAIFSEGVAEFSGLVIASGASAAGTSVTLTYVCNLPGYGTLTTHQSLWLYPGATLLWSQLDFLVGDGSADPHPLFPDPLRRVTQEELEPGVRFGHALALSESSAAVSAVYESGVQRQYSKVCSLAAGREFVPDVQRVTLGAAWQPEVQRLSLPSCAAPSNASSALAGVYSLHWRGLQTPAIDVHAPADYVKALMEETLVAQAGGMFGSTEQGVLEVRLVTSCADANFSRAPGAECDGSSMQGVSMLITFTNVYSAVDLLTLDAHAVSGSCPLSNLLTAVRIQQASRLNGTFRIGLPVVSPHAPVDGARVGIEEPFIHTPTAGTEALGVLIAETRALSVDASLADIALALEQDLHLHDLIIRDASDALMDAETYRMGLSQRSFMLTFAPAWKRFNVPLLRGNASGLAGAPSISIVTTQVTDGAAPLHGTFQLHIDGFASADIRVNARAEEVLAAFTETPHYLRSLTVETSQDDHPHTHACWLLSMEVERVPSPGELLSTPRQIHDYPRINVSVLAPAHTAGWTNEGSPELTQLGVWGSDARVLHRPLTNADVPEHVLRELESHPFLVGRVYVYAQADGQWLPSGVLEAPESAGNDLFGYSLALASHNTTGGVVEYLAVGAPAARRPGAYPMLELWCNATSGGLLLWWGIPARRSFVLPALGTRAALKAALEQIEGVGDVRVRMRPAAPGELAATDDRVCGLGGRSTHLTFLQRAADEVLAAGMHVTDAAGNATNTATIRAVTMASPPRIDERGAFSWGEAAGMVYVFRGDDNDWQLQSAVVWPHADAGQALFGWSVAASTAGGAQTGHTVVVGAPHVSRAGARLVGGVAVFCRPWASGGSAAEDAAAAWDEPQLLFPDVDYNTAHEGMQFGWTVALSSEGDTLAVGAPGADAHAGRVYLFKRQPELTHPFLLDQVLSPPTAVIPYMPSPLFGHALAMSYTTLVIGAPQASIMNEDADRAHAASGVVGERCEQTGAAFIYERIDWGTEGGYFRLQKAVCSELAKPGDGYGAAVAAADGVVLVASLVPSLEATSFGRESASGADEPLIRQLPSGNVAHTVQSVQVLLPLNSSTAAEAHTLSGNFQLGWRVCAAHPADGAPPTPACTVRRSRRLPWNATPRMLRTALEEDVGTGRVRVTRTTSREAATLGYVWHITFLQDSLAVLVHRRHAPHEDAQVPLLTCDATVWLRQRTLTDDALQTLSPAAQAMFTLGSTLDMRATVPPAPTLQGSTLVQPAVRRIVAASRAARGSVHVWTRSTSSAQSRRWQAQAVMLPAAYQPDDNFGHSLAMLPDARHVLVGAPTRSIASAWVQGGDVVAGAAMLYDLGWLNWRMAGASGRTNSSSVLSVSEGSVVPNNRSAQVFAGYSTILAASHAVYAHHCDPVCTVPVPTPRQHTLVTGQAVQALVTPSDDWGVYDVLGTPTAHLPPLATLCNAAAASILSVTPRGASEQDAHAVLSDGTRWLATLMHAAGDDVRQRMGSGSTALPARFGYYPPASNVRARESAAATCGADTPPRSSICSFASLARDGGVHRHYDLAAGQDVVAEPDALLLAARAPRAGDVQAASNVSIPFRITNDEVAEDTEHFHVRLALAGVYPLFGSRLWQTVAVEDDADGSFKDHVYTQHMSTGALVDQLESTCTTARRALAMGFEHAHWGSVVKLLHGGAVMLAAAPALDGTLLALGCHNATRASAGTLHPEAYASMGMVAMLSRAPRMGWVLADVPNHPLALVAVSAPGIATVFVYLCSTSGAPIAGAPMNVVGGVAHCVQLTHVRLANISQAQLAAATRIGAHRVAQLTPADACGEANSLALSVDAVAGVTLAVGCSGVESVLVFASERFVLAPQLVGTTLSMRLSVNVRSSLWQTHASALTDAVMPHRFGASVVLQQRTLAVGAPGDVGAVLATSNRDAARAPRTQPGHVAVFQFVPNLSSAGYTGNELKQGTWRQLASWPAADYAVAHNHTLHVHEDSAQRGGAWVQHVLLQAPNAMAGDLFGATLAASGHTLAVGAPGYASRGNTTWDFETGDLRGWTAQGNAFNRQPTLHDAATERPLYATRLWVEAARRVGAIGRYYVSSFDVRAHVNVSVTWADAVAAGGQWGQLSTGQLYHATLAASDANATQAPTPSQDSLLNATALADAAVGSLTSEPFLLAGEFITFNVGGGCDVRTVYVELLVNGVATERATGACDTRMRRVTWDVHAFMGQHGVVRIVDAADGKWGHITADRFQFSWATHTQHIETIARGAVYVYGRVAASTWGGYAPHAGVNPSSTSTHAAAVPAAARGAIMPALPSRAMTLPCSSSGNAVLSCMWQLEARLAPSFSFPHMRFGAGVSVDESSGVVAVTAHMRAATAAPGAASNGAAVLESGGTEEEWLLAGNVGGLAIVPHHVVLRRAAQGAYARHVPGSSGSGISGTKEVLVAHPSNAAQHEQTSMYMEVGSSQDAAHSSAAWGATARGELYTDTLQLRASHPSSTSITHAQWDVQEGLWSKRHEAAFADMLALAHLNVHTNPYERAGLDAQRKSVLARREQGGGSDAPIHIPFAAAVGAPPVSSTLAFVFRADPQKVGGGGGLIAPRTWQPIEHSILQAPAVSAQASRAWARGQAHAYTVDVSGLVLAVGRPFAGEYGTASGSVTITDLSYLFLSFNARDWVDPAQQGGLPMLLREEEGVGVSVASFGLREFYSVPENISSGRIMVPVYRHGIRGAANRASPSHAVRTQPLVVHYATRDISARGVSQDTAAACMRLPTRDRFNASCGDYVHATGTLVFSASLRRQLLPISIMNDAHFAATSKAFALHLWVPGGVVPRGEEYSVVVRIDDDDTAAGTAFP